MEDTFELFTGLLILYIVIKFICFMTFLNKNE